MSTSNFIIFQFTFTLLITFAFLISFKISAQSNPVSTFTLTHRFSLSTLPVGGEGLRLKILTPTTYSDFNFPVSFVFKWKTSNFY